MKRNPCGREVGQVEARPDGLRELEGDQVAIALAVQPDFDTGTTEQRLRAGGLLLPGRRNAADKFQIGRSERVAGELRHDERPAITGDDQDKRRGEARGREPSLDQGVAWDEQARTVRHRLGLGVGLFAGEDRVEGGFEAAMGVFQRIDALGDDVVLREHLVHRARLFARELPVDIGNQQFVAEFGHDGLFI